MPYADPTKRKEYNRNYARRWMQIARAADPEKYKNQWHVWYSMNKAKRQRYAQKRRQNPNTPRNMIARIINRLKKECSSCGFNEHPAALDFHHRNRRSDQINVTMQSVYKYGWHRVIAELSHCNVLCANCHRMIHAVNSTIVTPKKEAREE
jgi:hypothetical protein